MASTNTDVYELHKPLTEGVDKMKWKNIILYDNHGYEQIFELGKEIYEIMNDHEVREQSLRSEYKEGLDLNMKISVNSFPQSDILKPWQMSIVHTREG